MEQYNIETNNNINELIYNINNQIQSIIYDYCLDENNNIPIEQYNCNNNYNTIWLDCCHINYIKVIILYNKKNNNIDIRLRTKEEIYTYNINCNNITNKIVEHNIISDWHNWFRSFVIDRIMEIKY